MTDMQARIQYLEDLEAIRRLKHYYYCHCVDRTVAGDEQAIEETISRFTEDIVADFTGLPLTEGKEAVAIFRSRLPDEKDIEQVVSEVWRLAKSNELSPKSLRTIPPSVAHDRAQHPEAFESDRASSSGP